MAANARPNYYTVAEAAKALDVARATVWRWIHEGRLPAYRVGPRRLRIKTDDLEAMTEPARAKRGRESRNGPKTLIGAGALRRIRLVDPERQADVWADYDAHRVRQVLKKAAGALADIDIEALKEDIHAARRQDSRGRPA